MWLTISSLMFGVFALNVVLGSMAKFSFLSDVGEMLVLLAATALFVVAILQKEAEAKKERFSENT
jgi:Ca2+/Na+ antiporter